jgi:hypothetical protein
MDHPEADAMEAGDPSQQVGQLEARIAELADVIESCRKAMLASKIAIAMGSALLIAIMLGVINFHPVGLIGAITMILGGVVLLGTNSSTADATTAALNAAEAERAHLIGQLDLRVVEEAEGRSLSPPNS